MEKCQKCMVPIKKGFSGMLKKLFIHNSSLENTGLCNRCATATIKSTTGEYTCQICDRVVDESAALTHVKAEEYLLSLIKKDHPEWSETEGTCPECINYYRDLIKKAKI